MNYLSYFFYVCLIVILSTTTYSETCLNTGDPDAHFKYTGLLTDESGNKVSGFQTIQMRLDLFSSENGIDGDYSQTFSSVEINDGVFSLDVGPCLPDLSKSYFVQLYVNNEKMSSRTKLLSLPLSINSLNSQKISGLTTQELFLKIDQAMSLVLADFSNQNIAPALDTFAQSLISYEQNSNNPHSVNKSQIGLDQVDNVKQLSLDSLQTVLDINSDINVPSSKAVAEHVSSQLSTINVTGFELENPNLVSHLSRQDNPHNVNKSQLGLDQVSNVLQLPMSYLQTVLSTTSDVNIPSSSAVATFIENRFLNQASKPSDALNTTEVANLKANNLADGSSPWSNKQDAIIGGNSSQYFRGDKTFQTLDKAAVGLNLVPNSNIAYSTTIAADQFTSSEVGYLKANALANGDTPWVNKENSITETTTGDYFRGDKTFQPLNKATVGLSNVPNTNIAYSVAIPADQFLESEVTHLRANKLKDGSTPWAAKQDQIVAGTTSQYFRGDKTFQTLDKATIGLDQVENTNVLNSFIQNPDQSIETTTIKANNPEGLELVNSSNQGIVITTYGHVGVGTSSPNARLQISGQSNNISDAAIGIKNNASNGWSILRLQNTASNGREVKLALGGPTASINPNSLYVHDLTSNVTRFLINKSGKVGINTTAPQSLLDVNGDMKVSQLSTMRVDSQQANLTSSTVAPLRVSTNTMHASFIVSSSGRVGINTAIPMYDLEIIGNLNVSGMILQDGYPLQGGEQEVSYILESDRASVLDTTSNFDVPSSFAVGTYVNNRFYQKNSIPADLLTTDEVSNLQIGYLADGSTPWTNNLSITGLVVNGGASNSAQINNVDAGFSFETEYKHGGASKWKLRSSSANAGNRFGIFNSSDAEIVTLAQSGKVGIGTNNPSTTLHIMDANANVTIGNSSSQGGQLSFGNGNHGIKRNYNTANDIGMYTTAGNVYLSASGSGPTDKFVLTSGGNVGIGKANPSNILEVKAPGNANVIISSNLLSQESQINFQNGGVGKYTIGSRGTVDVGKPANRLGIFNSTASELATFLQTGSLGIGISEPRVKLDVAGGGLFRNGLNVSHVGAVTSNTLRIGDANFNFNLNTANPRAIYDGTAYMEYNRSAKSYKWHLSSSARFSIYDNGNITADSPSEIAFNVNAGSASNYSNISFNHSGSSKWVFSSRGSHDAGPNDRFSLWNANSTAEVFSVLQNGNVGIGIVTPDEKLHVVGGSMIEGYLCVGMKGDCDTVSQKNPGTIYSMGTSSIGADYAEYFATNETLVAGDVVGFDKATGKVRKYKNGDKLIGIISTKPGVIGAGNRDPKTHALVGLLGQLPVNRSQIVLKDSAVYTKDDKKIGLLLADGNVYINLNPADETADLKQKISDQQKQLDDLTQKINFLLQNK